jgi:hypothetical protein
MGCFLRSGYERDGGGEQLRCIPALRNGVNEAVEGSVYSCVERVGNGVNRQALGGYELGEDADQHRGSDGGSYRVNHGFECAHRGDTCW